jgi:hypothetical protein
MADEEQSPAFAVFHTPGNYANEPIDVMAKESPALRKDVKDKYVKRPALIQLPDSTWVQAVGVRRSAKEANGEYVLSIGVLAGAKGSHVPAPIVLQDVEQSRVPSSVAKQIIFGAIGAVYEKEGVQVEVKELYPDSAKHRIVAIGAEILDRNGEKTGMSIPRLNLKSFMSQYTLAKAVEPAVEQEDEEEEGGEQYESFEFSHYKKLTSALRISEAFGPDATSTTMPMHQAREILMFVLGGKPVAADADVATMAYEAETRLNDEKASPNMSRLTAVYRTGAFDDASQEQKAQAIVKFVMPGSVGTTTPPSSGTPKPMPGAPTKSKKKAPQAPVEEDTKSDDDSDSDDSDESDEDKPVGRNKPSAGGKRKAQEAFAESDEAEVTVPAVSTSSLSSLSSQLPVIDIARIIFADESVRAMAVCPAVPSSVPAGDIKKVAKRYGLAFERLTEIIGETGWRSRGGKPAKSKDVLEEWAERIVDKVARHQAAIANSAHTKMDVGSSSGATYRIGKRKAEEPAEEGTSSDNQKPAEGLTGAKQAAAVAPIVAERMHSNAAVYEQACQLARAKRPDAGAADMIGETPAELRNNLRRCGMANGHVDGPGETKLFRRALPPVGHGYRKTVLCEVEKAIRAVGKADMTGEVIIDSDVVSKLAASTQDGTLTLAEFGAAARSTLGQHAAKQGTPQAVTEAWSWMQPALTALLKALGAPHADIAALDEISNRVNAPAGLGRLSAAELADWIEKVLRMWKQAARDFRSRNTEPEAEMPSFRAAIESMSRNLEFKSLKAALKEQADSGSSSKARVQPKREQEASSSRSPAPRPSKAAANKDTPAKQPASSASSPASAGSAWPERKHVLPAAKFAELKEAAQGRYTGTCAFFLVAKCSNSKCSFDHKRPADFERFLNEHKVNLDGSLQVCT